MAKQNITSIREAHYKRNGDNYGADKEGNGKSKYAKKVKAGNQMYGDGKRGCAHRIKLAGER